ncbi:MAG TPA: precorrin-6y C5,15-methyltransferase (decarboxylating) subunit CbiE [Acidimicrobiales bacterium]
MSGPPVHVVGLVGGRPVGDAALAALQAARLVAGGRDQLAAVADLVDPGAGTVTVAAGLAALEQVGGHPGPVAVLASGDPGFHGIVRALAARLGAERLVVHPAPASVALAFARLGLPWDDAVVTSCHTGDAAVAAAQVAGAPVAAVLCGPAAPPEALGAALAALGAHHPTVVVATRLGEPGEAVHRLAGVADLAAGAFDHRSVVVLAHPAAPVRAGGRTGGRPTSAFHHRAGMITKPAVRSVVLGQLDLPERGVLWDVGAGSGSVAIEAALAAPGLRVVAVERDPEAVEAIVTNAAALGAVVEVVAGAAPAALAGLPRPDRVFVGGGGLDVLDAALAAAAPGARVVATYAAADRALAARERLGDLIQVSVDRATDLPGGGVRFEADNPVFVAWGPAPVRTDDAGGDLVVGVGCSSAATAGEMAVVVAEALDALDAVPLSDGLGVATIDRRADHPAVLAVAGGTPPVTFPAGLLAAVDVPHPSPAVDAAVGTPSVAEAAALLAAGPGARLVAGKCAGPTATAAVARCRWPRRHGRVTVVGLGPGGGWRWCRRATRACSPWPRSRSRRRRARGWPSMSSPGSPRPAPRRRPPGRRWLAPMPRSACPTCSSPGTASPPSCGPPPAPGWRWRCSTPARPAGPTTWPGPPLCCPRSSTPPPPWPWSPTPPARASRSRPPPWPTSTPQPPACGPSCWSARPTPRCSGAGWSPAATTPARSPLDDRAPGPPHRGRELPDPGRAGRPLRLAAAVPGRGGPGDPRRRRHRLRGHDGR